MNIHELAKLPDNRTDKQNEDHAFEGENYLHIYERYFEPVRQSVTRVLEIGVFGGHSLRLWRDYFPNAEIHGMDIDPSRAGHDTRITVHSGDQNSFEDLKRMAGYGPFDIIIDDGSHISEHIIRSFDKLFPFLKPKGFYCIEDLGCTHVGVNSGWPGMFYNIGIENVVANRKIVDDLILETARNLDHRLGFVRAMHLHPMVMVIQKI